MRLTYIVTTQFNDHSEPSLFWVCSKCFDSFTQGFESLGGCILEVENVSSPHYNDDPCDCCE